MLGWFKTEKYYHRASILEELYMKPRKLPDVKKYFTEKIRTKDGRIKK